MTDIEAIEGKVGALPQARCYESRRDAPDRPTYRVIIRYADDMEDELLTVVERLVGERDALQAVCGAQDATLGHLRADLAAMTAERDKYHDTLLSKHGGEPLALLDELDEARRDLSAAREERCRNCEHWDREHAETVANVAFAYCDNKIATKEFKSSVVSEGWLCPLLARYQPAEEASP